MPALVLKVLRVVLEYGALLWLAYAVLYLGRQMFTALRADIRASHTPAQTAGGGPVVRICKLLAATGRPRKAPRESGRAAAPCIPGGCRAVELFAVQ